MAAKIKKYTEQILSLISCIEREEKELSNKLSSLDKEVSERYHEIETTNFNAALGFKLAKDLQDTLRRRREVKNEIAMINAVTNAMNIKTFNGSIQTALKNIEKAEKKQKEYAAEANKVLKIG